MYYAVYSLYFIISFAVTSPLNPSNFTEASATAGSAALAAEHHANDAKCSELGWKCVPLHRKESLWNHYVIEQ